jgi:predicted DNA-binding ribbon-helix-helix protein
MIRRRVLPYQESKQSVVVGQRKTSLRLEVGFWVSLKEIAAHEGVPVSALVTRIDLDREHANLSSTLRIYVLDHYRRLAEEAAPGGGKTKRS